VDIAPAATPTASVSELKLTAAAFQFSDPPEPGAAARLSLTVHNPTDRASGPIALALPLRWLSGYRIQATDPPLVNGSQSNGVVRLSFEGAGPEADAELSIDVAAIDEVIDAPQVTVFDAEGREVGRVHPATQAPPARPGPIYSIDIPRLRLHSGVVPVEWEPPLFVIGQVRTSAFVTLGNSVLVGHLRGAAGYNVFDHLDQLTPGDEVIATSRGQPYTFVVRQTQVLEQNDTSPTIPTSLPRLTLMTCAGEWDPLTRDYPERLWVIAEPAGLNAEATQPQSPALRRLTALQ
jgi:LPXTG-site transpeptidase (sortase) family protein